MAVQVSYPGVYLERVPSGVRTIMGVATSITAFVGRAVRGPVNEPITIHSFGDFERRFGGLAVNYPMSYAVRDFFLNGGAQVIIVRLYKKTDPENNDGSDGNNDGSDGNNDGSDENNDGSDENNDDSDETDVNRLALVAASPGTWANGLRARVEYIASSDLPWLADFGLDSGNLFNLAVRDTKTGATETFLNLTVADSPRRIDRVLADESQLVRLSGDPPAEMPSEHDKPGDDDDIWGNAKTSSPVSTAGGDSAPLDQATYEGSESDKTGLYALDDADLFNLLCIPADRRGGTTPPAVYQTAMSYCVDRRAVLIVDPPHDWNSSEDARTKLNKLGLTGVAARNAALYFPRIKQADSLLNGQIETFVPCGVVAGVIARTDAQRGVWKAPAGIDAALRGAQGVSVKMTDKENGMLNPLGINCLRTFPVTGHIVWGARTLRGADQLADEYKYLPVQRLALFIEESLYRGTQWVVFEPNDEPLWSQIRLNVGAFMHNLFRQGAFQGSSPKDAYFVKSDGETTTQHDINLGIVNVVVGFAPLKPAEFVIIKIQQIAGQIET